ncbi:MAG: DUF6602 domain-containing protein, partial [Bacteroidota bacterium]
MTDKYYASLVSSFLALKERIEAAIPPSSLSGQAYVSCMKKVLRSCLGPQLAVGRGQIVGVTQNRVWDILIYRSDQPVVFRDDDWVLVKASQVRAAIAVPNPEPQPLEDTFEAFQYLPDHIWKGIWCLFDASMLAKIPLAKGTGIASKLPCLCASEDWGSLQLRNNQIRFEADKKGQGMKTFFQHV